MIHDGMKASAAAMRVGYESASQFSREFKRYFGVTPGEDAARMQGDAGECNDTMSRYSESAPNGENRSGVTVFLFNHHDNSVPNKPGG